MTPEIKMVAVNSLVPYARNARTHSDAQVAQIAASIAEFGFTNPILTDGARGVIAGHGRLAAARKLALTDVPVIELSHLTAIQKKAYILADNRIAANAGWDEELLKLELVELDEADFNLEFMGFDAEEIELQESMKGVRNLIREMLLEDLTKFKEKTKYIDYMHTMDDPTFDDPYYKDRPYKAQAKDIKRAWAAEADHEFMKSIIKVHWLSGFNVVGGVH